jgi:hypothetical protein
LGKKSGLLSEPCLKYALPITYWEEGDCPEAAVELTALSGQQRHYILCLRHQYLLPRARQNSKAAKTRASSTPEVHPSETPLKPLLLPNGKASFFEDYFHLRSHSYDCFYDLKSYLDSLALSCW